MSQASRQSQVWSHDRRLLTVGLLLTVSTAAVEALAVAATMPATVAAIGGLEYYGWAFAGFMVAEVVGIAAAGRFADAGGLARPFAVGSALFAVGLLAAGLAATMPQLLTGRAVQGLGAGAISSLAYAAVARAYADDAKPRMLSLLSTAWVVPGLIGPAAAGAVADHCGWRWVFLGVAPLIAVGAVLVVPALRRLEQPQETIHVGSGGLSPAFVLALGCLVLMAASEVSSPWNLLTGVFGVAIAIPALGRLLPPGTFSAQRGIPAAVAAMALLSASFFSAEIFVPLALADVRGQSTAFAGLVLTASTLGWTAGAWWQERLAPRRRRSATASAGLVLLLAGILAIGAVIATSVPAWIAFPAWTVAGLGIGLAYTTIALAMLESAAPGREGEVSASLQLANVLGTAAGTGAAGAVVANAAGAGAATASTFLLVGALAIGVGALGLIVARRLG